MHALHTIPERGQLAVVRRGVNGANIGDQPQHLVSLTSIEGCRLALRLRGRNGGSAPGLLFLSNPRVELHDSPALGDSGPREVSVSGTERDEKLAGGARAAAHRREMEASMKMVRYRILALSVWVCLAAGAERQVTFSGVGGITLRGTLQLPDGAKGKVPAALLLAGSGPTDRNGNQPPTLLTDLLKQIADRLATEGWASLRYDKRAARAYAASWPKDFAAQNDFFSWDTFVDDAKAGLTFLRAQAEVDTKRTVVGGHSEGATIAMQIAHDLAGKPGAAAGLLLLSAPGRPGGDVLREQVAANLKRAGLTADQTRTYTDYVDQAIAQVVKDGTVPPNPPPGLGGLFPRNATRLLQVELTFDPPKILPLYPGPVLVIQGKRTFRCRRRAIFR
jgi:dienelactone hydrolase